MQVARGTSRAQTWGSLATVRAAALLLLLLLHDVPPLTFSLSLSLEVAHVTAHVSNVKCLRFGHKVQEPTMTLALIQTRDVSFV